MPIRLFAMPTAELEQTECPEAEAVLRWRLDELLRAGYDVGTALALAATTDVDLHAAARLLARGCPVELAGRILL